MVSFFWFVNLIDIFVIAFNFNNNLWTSPLTGSILITCPGSALIGTRVKIFEKPPPIWLSKILVVDKFVLINNDLTLFVKSAASSLYKK